MESILKYLFPPEITHIHWRPMTIVGLPETGKTNLSFFLAQKIINKFGDNNVNFIYTQDLRKALYLIDRKMIQVIVIDDAIRYQYSGTFVQDKEIIADYFEIRHIFGRLREKGIVYVMFLTQRWYNLDPAFRNSPIVVFKSLLMDKKDNEMIKKLIGEHYYNELKRITKNIYTENKDRDKAIITTAWGETRIISGITKAPKPKITITLPPRNGKITLNLNDIEKKILILRLKGRKLKTIGEKIGKSEKRVHAILTKIMRQIEGE